MAIFISRRYQIEPSNASFLDSMRFVPISLLLFSITSSNSSRSASLNSQHLFKMYGFEAMTFNIHGGYLEAIVRGYRSGLLTAADYNNLCQCETLDDIKMHLSATDYGPYLQNGNVLTS